MKYSKILHSEHQFGGKNHTLEEEKKLFITETERV